MKTEGADRAEALATLRYVLETLSKMIAPFTPFLAEVLYQHIEGDFSAKTERLSVHLEDWPEVEEARIDQDVLGRMAETRQIVSQALERRVDAKINVRQPLASMTVTLPSGELGAAYIDVIKDEVNVKDVLLETGEQKVELDTVLTPELKQEGMIRELIRRVNAMRKQAGLTIDDRIALTVVSTSEDVQQALETHEQTLLESTLANTLSREGEAGEEIVLGEETVTASIQKL
jgi:isoleucyl-tRNA synthetase